MKNFIHIIVLISLFIASCNSKDDLESGDVSKDIQAKRDPLKWPFASSSIWNMPVHNDAIYVPAEINTAKEWGMTIDEDHIIFYDSSNPVFEVYEFTDYWIKREELAPGSKVLFTCRIPDNYKYYHASRNNCFTIFTDETNFIQTQPMQFSSKLGVWTSKYLWPKQSIYESGIRGAHGGSGMSALGGTIRLGELKPGSTIRHALKMNIFTKLYAYYSNNESDGKPGYRWPALACDTGANDPNHGNYYGGNNPEVQMGSLMALKPDFDVSNLRTEPARIIARALQNYGAYIVDNTAWDVYALATEEGPQGSLVNEVLADYGIKFMTSATVADSKGVNTETWNWVKDMSHIFTNLHVIANNSITTIGGGPNSDVKNRRAPIAPDFQD